MVAEILEPRLTALLRILARSADGRVSAGDLRKKLAAWAKQQPGDSTDAEEAGRTLGLLVDRGLVSMSGGLSDGPHPRPNASYRLTEEGRDSLRPSRPDLPEEQLQAQEAFVLLQIFRAREHRLTRSELNAKLKTRAAVGQLEFDVKGSPATVEYHLASLVRQGSLEEQRRGDSATYTLNPDSGPAALAASKQHDAVSFTLTGATLNALLASARRAETLATPHEPVFRPTIPDPQNSAASPRDITLYVDQLRSDRYAGKDLIPIFEVRRLVASHHGDEAAAHSAFDPLIKRMRAEGQLELIAISDNRGATQDQLDDAIPGMNETLFYIVVE